MHVYEFAMVYLVIGALVQVIIVLAIMLINIDLSNEP